MSVLNPYLSFKDNAREAMEFYQSVLGGELLISTFGEMPDTAGTTPGHLVMHAHLTTPDGMNLMGADTPDGVPYAAPAGVTVSVSGDDEATLTGYWNALADGGTVTMPFDVPPFGGKFGMLVDKFGIAWMVYVNPAQ